MATIVTRAGKGSPLTSAELDQNQINLNTDKAELSGATFTGAVTANAGVVVDNITIDGNEIDVGSGDLTLDVAGNISLDADGGNILLLDGGTRFANISASSTDLVIQASVQDRDIFLKGNDGGSVITALTLDMSDAGTATFNHDVKLGSGGIVMADTFNNRDNNANIIFRSGSTTVVGNNSTALVISDSGTTSFGGVVTANAGVVVDNFTLDGTTLALSSGNMTLDSAGDIVLDSDGGNHVATFNDNGLSLVTDTARLLFTKADGTNIAFVGDLTGSGQGGVVYYNQGTPTIQLKSFEASQINTGMIFNEGGADLDFRVESNGNANMLFVDGGANKVGVGTGSPSKLLHLSESTDGTKLRLTRGGVCEWDFSIGNTSTLSGVGAGALELLPQNGGTANEFAIGKAGTTEALVHITNSGTTFNNGINVNGTVTANNLTMADDEFIRLGNSNDFVIVHSSSQNIIQAAISDQDIIFKGNDGGSAITALTLDMSAAGAATFNSSVTSTGMVVSNSSGATINVNTAGGGVDAKILLHETSTASSEFGASLKYSGANNRFEIGTGQNAETSRLQIDRDTGNVRFNPGGVDSDFRVESSGNDHAFFVQGSDGLISFGGATTSLTTGTSFVASDNYALYSGVDATSAKNHCVFGNGNGYIGSITTNGSATAYNTSSDQRLKENIADADDAGSKIDAIQVRKFDWKVDGSHQDYGMVAQELQTVAPEAVSAPENPEDMMAVDYSKLVPMLVKEIQTLRSRITALENA